MLDTPEPLVPMGAAYYPVSNAMTTRHYAFLLLPDFTLLAFSAAIDAFRIANQLSQKPLYRWSVLSEDGNPVCSSCGVSINAEGGLTPLSRDTTLFVCSGNLSGRQERKPTLAFVSRHYRFGGTVGGLCTGAVTLAQAGLLEGRTFTLHWENQPGFTELFPQLVPSQRKLEIDGRILTCGGGAAATDMALAIIAQDHGREFATIVSDMCLRRADVGSDQSQRSSLGTVLQTRNPRLISVVRLMIENFEAPLSMEELAGRVGYTRRQIERLFQLCLGESPAQFYRNIRLDHARSLLTDTEMTLFEIAAACGFETKTYFARAFKQRFGCPPSRLNYRQGVNRHPIGSPDRRAKGTPLA